MKIRIALAAILAIGLAGCFGGGGSSGSAAPTVTQSNITLPTTVQVVSAN